MKGYFTWAVALLIVACSAPKAPVPEYRLLKEEPGGFGKLSLYVELPSERTSEELELIAQELRGVYEEPERLYIFYLLPDMELGRGAWAITHYTPGLSVEILGNTAAEKEAATKDPEPDPLKEAELIQEELLGKWYEQQITRMGFALVKRDNDLFMKLTMGSGVTIEQQVKRIPGKKGDRLEQVNGDPHGEYYVLESNGELGLYSPDGRFAVAKKVN